MKETGLMFKAPLVRAILAGKKTQTRRILNPQPAENHPHDGGTKWVLERGRHTPVGSVGHLSLQDKMGRNCPMGKPGDRIYVRETWQGPLMSSKEWEEHYFSGADDLPAHFRTPTHCQYAADGGLPPEFMTMDDELVSRWKPSIHMPKWASRIWLEITGVRVERLQSISDADLEREGIQEYIDKGDDHDGTPRDTFRKLWETTGGDWAANPWVWVIDFKRIERAVGAAQGEA